MTDYSIDLENYRESIEFDNDLTDLAILLVHLREYRGLTQRQLSELSGVQYYYICNIENKKASTTFITMSKLFNAMGYNIAEAYQLIPAKIIRQD